jgi:hypothetical protein|tara:strand:+ start:276 stop:539 length:264 start_codon:yes stop_codon:yes gene_type:complete
LTIKEQRRLLKMWFEFIGARAPTNSLMRQFYFEEILDCSLYRYGMATEFFDVLINGVFDADQSKVPARAPELLPPHPKDGAASTCAA